VIHSFEPSPRTFEKLVRHCEGLADVRAWNCGVGAMLGSLPLYENDHSDMSSFLVPGPTAWGRVVRTTDVPVVSLDEFACREGIDYIDVLKSDTQGYELDVFRGAAGLLQAGRIQLIYFEVIASDMYAGIPPYHEMFRFLDAHGYRLVSVYNQQYRDGRLNWMDVLFCSDSRRG
jgi:FkbM family methyltransferase